MTTVEKILIELQKPLTELRVREDGYYLVDINGKWSKLRSFNFDVIRPYLHVLSDDGTGQVRYGKEVTK